MSGTERREIALSELRGAVRHALEQPGWRYGHQTARTSPKAGILLEVLLLNTTNGRSTIFSAPIPDGTNEYPSLTPYIPAAHWAERAIGDFFGLKAEGHPRWKSLILHEAWPDDLTPLCEAPSRKSERVLDRYEFMEVRGEGVHEIPVGPIHAGIIEPGHFRFSCLGEIISNLEIRLGYQHRGVELRMTEMPWQQTRFLAEAASSDTTIGNALAHAVAVEQILDVTPPPRAQWLRTIVLEIERLANHLGDFGGLSADIGYSVGAATFARLRGVALGLGEMLAGSRFQRAFVLPGGVARDIDDARRSEIAQALCDLKREIESSVPLVLENPSVIERMEGTGRLSPSLAREFGIVGPAGRASGSSYDARSAFDHGVFPACAPVPARRESGDVLARAQMRGEEIKTSLSLVRELLDSLPESPVKVSLPESLPSGRVGVGVVEAWRGELIHWITTGDDGSITRYALRDPSFSNWTGLAIAVRGNLVADFPLCNKSFNLSYSGNDL
jgi:Ni,Fe-hydrogenase III large subunit/NADH:ubiquinone oxidoreductase subunit C